MLTIRDRWLAMLAGKRQILCDYRATGEVTLPPVRFIQAR